jgi:hypothetical protein
MRVSSPDRRCRSMAGSICIERNAALPPARQIFGDDKRASNLDQPGTHFLGYAAQCSNGARGGHQCACVGNRCGADQKRYSARAGRCHPDMARSPQRMKNAARISGRQGMRFPEGHRLPICNPLVNIRRRGKVEGGCAAEYQNADRGG